MPSHSSSSQPWPAQSLLSAANVPRWELYLTGGDRDALPELDEKPLYQPRQMEPGFVLFGGMPGNAVGISSRIVQTPYGYYLRGQTVGDDPMHAQRPRAISPLFDTAAELINYAFEVIKSQTLRQWNLQEAVNETQLCTQCGRTGFPSFVDARASSGGGGGSSSSSPPSAPPTSPSATPGGPGRSSSPELAGPVADELLAETLQQLSHGSAPCAADLPRAPATWEKHLRLLEGMTVHPQARALAKHLARPVSEPDPAIAAQRQQPAGL
jgi:hypothetical protein